MPTPTIHLLKNSFVASLWLGVLGSPIIWAIHLQVLYSLVKFAGRGHSFGWMYATTATCFALVVGCGVFSWRDLQEVRDDPADTESDEPAGRTRFLALLGVCGSALFGLVILATGFATFFFKASWE